MITRRKRFFGREKPSGKIKRSRGRREQVSTRTWTRITEDCHVVDRSMALGKEVGLGSRVKRFRGSANALLRLRRSAFTVFPGELLRLSPTVKRLLRKNRGVKPVLATVYAKRVRTYDV